MVKEEIIRKENKEISELILAIFKNVKKDYKEKEIENLKRIEIENTEKYDIERLFKERTQKKEVEYVTEKMAMVEYKKSIFTKIKNWLKRNF